ncbi:MAG: hypothetical protein WAL72_08780 [Streptosporangiaceae bacterium]
MGAVPRRAGPADPRTAPLLALTVDIFADPARTGVAALPRLEAALRTVHDEADNAPEVMLSLVTAMAIPSGLKASVARDQRASSFPYVVPA